MNESHAASVQRPVGFVSQDFLDGKWDLDHIAKSDEGQISRTIPVFTRAQPSAEPAGYFRNVTGDDDLIQRWEQSEFVDDGSVPLYAHPPAAELEALRRDAERYRALKPMLFAANFEEGADLIFRLPDGSRVSASLDATIDAAIAQQEAP